MRLPTICRNLLLGWVTVLMMQPVHSATTDPTPQRIPIEDVQRFSVAISHIKNYHVKDIENKKLFNDAIQGMLAGLDPHSAFLDERAFKELQTNTHGEFGGLGIEVTMEKGAVKVIAPMNGTPAHKAGLQSGDYIIKIDDAPLLGMSLGDAVKKMRGKPGSKIELVIVRPGEKAPIKKELKREVIVIESVKSKLYDKRYGYVQISNFQENTAKQLIKEVKALKQQADGPIKGLVLDLRNNPGGLLDTAIATSDVFINAKDKDNEPLIVYTEGRLPNSRFTAKATPGDILNNAPMVVLINGGSASGSEIVAGALKDNKRALLLGTKSFGKGSVQTVLPIDKTTAIKLTTALYYTPAGTSIQAKGIMPDIIIKNVKLPEKKKDQVSLQLSETDLSKHLANGNGKSHQLDKSGKAADQNPRYSSKDLLYKDYQLHEAMNVLKAISFH